MEDQLDIKEELNTTTVSEGSLHILDEVYPDQESSEHQADRDSTETTFDGSLPLEVSIIPDPDATLNISKINPHNPAFLKPLESGWKREMVLRNPNADRRRRVDVYYYTPSGKKLRSLKSIAEHLEGTGLTLENFTFTRSSVGVDDPEKEIVRNAKRSYSDDSFEIAKKVKRRSSCDLTGTPKVVLKNSGDVEDPCDAPRDSDLDEESCSWLPPMWGKLLGILNRNCET